MRSDVTETEKFMLKLLIGIGVLLVDSAIFLWVWNGILDVPDLLGAPKINYLHAIGFVLLGRCLAPTPLSA